MEEKAAQAVWGKILRPLALLFAMQTAYFTDEYPNK